MVDAGPEPTYELKRDYPPGPFKSLTWKAGFFFTIALDMPKKVFIPPVFKKKCLQLLTVHFTHSFSGSKHYAPSGAV